MHIGRALRYLGRDEGIFLQMGKSDPICELCDTTATDVSLRNVHTSLPSNFYATFFVTHNNFVHKKSTLFL